jgi:putative PIN family toxin of toxin-antitoxin system
VIRVVLDTNVVVSAYLNSEGPPFRVLKLALAGLVRLCASEPILGEYRELLHRKSFPLDSRRAVLLLRQIRSASTIVRPTVRLKVCSDPDDNAFLECAQSAKAE